MTISMNKVNKLIKRSYQPIKASTNTEPLRDLNFCKVVDTCSDSFLSLIFRLNMCSKIGMKEKSGAALDHLMPSFEIIPLILFC